MFKLLFGSFLIGGLGVLLPEFLLLFELFKFLPSKVSGGGGDWFSVSEPFLFDPESLFCCCC